ncbi:MAG: branched-chain-amino-acid transaminase [Phycisphaerae bacterium]
MGLKIYLNGQLVERDQARIGVYDHGLLYGDGVFEGIRCYNGKVFQIDAHVDRLFDSAAAIRLQIPLTREQVKQAIAKTLQANNLHDAYIRAVVTRGEGCLGLSPKNTKPSIFIITDTIELYPAELYEKGLEVITCTTIRNHPNALSPRIKSLNYLNNILAKIEALDAGVLEAIMLNHLGYVAECTGDNIFIVRKNVLLTPPREAGILEGITRNVVMDLARKIGLTVCEENLTRYDLYTADECFLTGTAAEVIPVTKIDGRIIGAEKVGPITKKLITAFHEFAQSGE